VCRLNWRRADRGSGGGWRSGRLAVARWQVAARSGRFAGDVIDLAAMAHPSFVAREKIVRPLGEPDG